MVNQVHSPERLLESLCALPRETDWIEFKENKFNEDSVGQYVSSLANSAMLLGQDTAYLVFGVTDDGHEIVGTTVDMLGETVGNEAFVLWLNKYLEPHVGVEVKSFFYDNKRIEILCIDPAYRQPVKFKKIAYIRIGTAQQPLSNYPERERALWQITSRYSFETTFLKQHMTKEEIIEAFSYKQLLTAIGQKPPSIGEAFDYMQQAGLIKGDLQGKYEISALLAMSCAVQLDQFPAVEQKGTRLLVYRGKDKMDAVADT